MLEQDSESDTQSVGEPSNMPSVMSRRLTSTRSSLRRSKQKLDEFFKSPSLDILRSGSKRKRHKTECDTLSLQSVDITIEEPKKKKRTSLAKVSSFANLLSPIRNGRKVSNVLQKSLSLRNLTPNGSSSKHQGTPYRKPNGSSTLKSPRRLSTFWYETMDNDDIQQMGKMQIERQEAIFELYKGEEDLIEDFSMVKKVYQSTIKKLGLMSEEELEQIFGDLDSLIPIHQDLVDLLKDQRLPDGTTECVGHVIRDWIPQLEAYVNYCANQVYAKAQLDAKRQDPAVDDFLQRCQDCPASRRLDLWSFLDVPRSRIVKYPIILKNIEKLTPAEHSDLLPLSQAIRAVEEVIFKVDRSTGHSKCQYTKDMLEFLDEKTQQIPEIETSKTIVCDGVLKNNRGTKLNVFLFEHVLVLTRPATRGTHLKYQVYRQPIPATELIVEEISDGQEKRGSFKTAFSNNNTCKHQFKVSFRDPSLGQAHTLQANDEHDKRQWITALRSVLPPKSSLSSSSSSSSSLESLTGSTSVEKENVIPEADEDLPDLAEEESADVVEDSPQIEK